MRKSLAVFVALAVCGACGSRVRNWPEEAVAVERVASTLAPRPDRTTSTTTTATQGPLGDVPANTTGPSIPNRAARSTLPHPAPGLYTYDIETHVPAFEDEPAQDDSGSYSVTWSVSGSSTALTLVETDESDFATTYRVTASALELQGVAFDDEEDGYRCNYSPPEVLLKLPLAVGSKWSSDSTCSYEDGEVDRVSLVSEVTGTATDTVGGSPVETFVVRWTETFVQQYPDDDEVFTSKTQRVAHVDPKTLLIVSEELRDQSADGLGESSKRTLRSMTPR